MSELFLSPQVKKSCCLIRNSNLKRNDNVKCMNGKDVFIERPNSSVTQTSEIVVGNAISGKFTVELLSIMIRKSKCIRHVALSFKRNLR